MARVKFLYQWKLAIGLPLKGPEPTCPLKPPARHVARVLSEHMDADGGNCRPSGGRIATEMGCDVATVWRAIENLEEKGYIRRFATRHTGGLKGGRSTPNLYVPTIPETVAKHDGFLALVEKRRPTETVAKSEKNRRKNARKPSQDATQGFRGPQEDSSGLAADSVAAADATANDARPTFCIECDAADGECDHKTPRYYDSTVLEASEALLP